MGTNRGTLIAVAAALLVVVVGGGVAIAAWNKDRTNTAGSETTTPAGSTAVAPAANTAAAPPVLPPDEQCTDAIKSNTRWVCLTKATMDGDKLTVEYEFNSGANPFNINGNFHVHLYGANADGSDPADSVMGAQASRPGNWYIEDKQPSVHEAGSAQYKAIDGHPKVCARIARGNHQLMVDNSGKNTFTTGNCVPLTKS